MKELIARLVEAYGPSGNEEQVRALIQDEIKAHVDEARVDALGNLVALLKSDPGGQGKPPTRVMVAAHMDEIGIIVTHIDEEGFLRFAPIGGLTPLTILGNRAVFANGVTGTFGMEKREILPTEKPKLDRMFLDIGAPDKESALKLVSVGDAAAFSRGFAQAGNRLLAKAMDDRIGCAILIQVVKTLKRNPNDIYFVFTVQEEVGCRGAVTSTYGVQPDLAIAVDATDTGDTPEARPMNVTLGKGPAIKVKDAGMLAHPAVRRLLVEAAKGLGIPYQLEVLEGGSTDAMVMQTSREGVPSGVVSIPCRYVHSPSEMVDYDDVTNAVKLLIKVLEDRVTI
ncbi:MAG: M42 family metallopeptidase [Chloroflexota bacterium]